MTNIFSSWGKQTSFTFQPPKVEQPLPLVKEDIPPMVYQKDITPEDKEYWFYHEESNSYWHGSHATGGVDAQISTTICEYLPGQDESYAALQYKKQRLEYAKQLSAVKQIESIPVVMPKPIDKNTIEYLRDHAVDASSEQALTCGLGTHLKGLHPSSEQFIVAHLFGGPYDAWVTEYNPSDRCFFGFISFGGLDDECAEWGYVSLDELLKNHIKRDYWWTPCSFESLKSPASDEQVLDYLTNPEPELSNSDALVLEMEGPAGLSPILEEKVIDIDTNEVVFSHTLCEDYIRDRYKTYSGKTIPQLKSDIGTGGGTAPFGWYTTAPGVGIILSNIINSNDPNYIQFKFSWVDVWDLLNTLPQSVMFEQTEVIDGDALMAPLKKRKLTKVEPGDESFKEAVVEQPKQIPQRTYEPKCKYEVATRITEPTIRETLNKMSLSATGEQGFLSYSGDGKLHDLEFKAFDNFHDYTKAKQEFEMGQFFTPDTLCRDIVKLCEINDKVKVADVNCGTGRFFNWLPNEANIFGIEYDSKARDIAKSAFNKGSIYNRDFFQYLSFNRETISYMLGNPPFNLVEHGLYDHPLATDNDAEDGGQGNVLSQNHYIKCCEYYLEQGGVAAFIVPDTFLEQELRDKKVNAFIDEFFWRVATIRLPINTFSEYQIKFPTKVLVLMKKSTEFDGPNLPQVETTFEDFYKTEMGQWFYHAKRGTDLGEAKRIYREQKQTAEVKHQILKIRDKLLKAIYEYKRSPNCKEEKLDEFRSAYTAASGFREPEDSLSAYSRLTKDIVRATRHKHINELYIRIYPSEHHINFERSNSTVSEYVNSELKCDSNAENGWAHSLPNRISKNEYIIDPMKFKSYYFWIYKLLEKKHFIKYKGEITEIKIINELGRNYLKQLQAKHNLNTTPTQFLKDVYGIQYEQNMETLDELRFGDKVLLPHQKEDLAGMLMKDFALISWDTGLGKTLGGIAYTYIKGGRTLVLAPSVNTIDPWKQQLTEYVGDRSVFLCRTTKDITKYKGEDYLICSIENTPNIYQHLKRWKFANLILDESDNIKNKSSTRAKTIKAIANRIKRKILMSGTPTRNNILEIYNQVELLCRNSTNMICYAERWFEYNRSSREYDECRNPNFMQPFPAYGGHKAFERTFSPRKVTCFGANETNQDILNSDAFTKMIEPVRFTRIFDDEKPRIDYVLGKMPAHVKLLIEERCAKLGTPIDWSKPFVEITSYIDWKDIEDQLSNSEYKEWKQVIVPMSEHEGKVYEFILEEFAKAVEEHYRKMHDGATASKLVIMRQILELLQGTSHPWTYLGYDGPKVGTKLLKALEIIEQAKVEGRKVMIASPWVETAHGMEELFNSKGFPVFRITTEMSKAKRATLVHEFRNYPGFAIITGTMGCLKSGLNLPEVSVVIAESYPWNMAQLKQYAARAIRLNSTEKTIIHCLCSEGSFDVNVFGLLVKKEVTNEFVRTSEEVSTEDIRSELGVGADDDFYQAALNMVRERVDGRMRGTIKWNDKQVIS